MHTGSRIRCKVAEVSILNVLVLKQSRDVFGTSRSHLCLEGERLGLDIATKTCPRNFPLCWNHSPGDWLLEIGP